MKRLLQLYYFAYGSNLHKEQMQNRCPDSIPIAKATLADYELTFKGNWRGNGVADIQPKDGDSVTGAIYKVSKFDRESLDRYEGYPRLYNRHVIEVVREDTGEIVKAFVYRMLDHYMLTPPGEAYFSIIADGYSDWGIDIKNLETANFKLNLV
ncbi:AIG2 family protein [Desulfofarcimen acetoxidans DSM 771]|uniref:AIG2 family protein n=1 Tax=Desulfofarcimen acetoxidans (strain ATCC 49208 / DSM 771 / KCTC 5769 / VKM B-1644 / 5575) TaxID=485916 RepID=C8VXX5_DESAS|nr:gamma-glutamylcyclotransferase family protein [Desulfofarcimen acetoxidans]ACV64604.1 AIG2 family protein [Desulfofarcimen acetoxidans DSM 771]